MVERRVGSRTALGGALVLLAASTAAAQALAPITAGAPPVAIEVPQAPGVTLTITAPTEVQIDATAASMDAQLHLFRGEELVTQDSDSGDGVNARIVTFLAPGSYDVRVSEWRGRTLAAQLQARTLPPMTPVATMTPGTPAVVNVPHADTPRDSSVEVALTITAAGTYQIDATDPSGQFDPELMLIQNSALLGSDSDSGGNRAARLTQALTPGEYRVRVRDWTNRACAVTVTATAQQ